MNETTAQVHDRMILADMMHEAMPRVSGAESIWNYAAQPKEPVFTCNLCDSGAAGLYVHRDRYGYESNWVRCMECDSVYLSRRMTREAYARFYETAYRPLVSAFHGREINAQTIQPEQREYGYRLAEILRGYVHSKGMTLLDVGGSTGVVARALETRLGVVATALDPCAEELYAAPVRVILGTIEEFEPKTYESWHFVTMCQTADHLLDLMGSLKKIRGLLSPDGLFWSDIVNFDITREVKIDHPFNLTESTYRKFLSKAGFRLLQVNYAPDGKHIGFLCKGAA